MLTSAFFGEAKARGGLLEAASAQAFGHGELLGVGRRAGRFVLAVFAHI